MDLTNAAERRASKDGGFSLLELMISLGLTVFVITTAYLLLNTVTTDSNMVQARTQAAEENRAAVEVLTTEIRQAMEITEGYGVFDPAIYSPSACAFYSDIDRDGAPEKVKYDLLAGKLVKSVYPSTTMFAPYSFASVPEAGFPKTVCSGVTNSDIFRYVDGQDPPVDVPASASQNTATVILHIVDTSVVGGDTGRSDITTWVNIRTINSTLE